MAPHSTITVHTMTALRMESREAGTFVSVAMGLHASLVPGLRAANRLEFGFSLLVYQAAIEGLGVALAQPEFVEEEMRSGRLIAPFRYVLSTGNWYFIVCPMSRRQCQLAGGRAGVLQWPHEPADRRFAAL